MKPLISFRPITDDDQELLYRIYASTREDELAVTGWNAEQKEVFLRQQFHAQHHHYQKSYDNATFDVILFEGEPVGRLYVDRREDEHRIVDIALLTEHRGKGLGGQIMQDLLDEAAAAGKYVRIHVEKFNPARHLYDRLGFREVEQAEEQPVYVLMEWKRGTT
jgi:ribosomal protein S18 acetylase RimI-like enzyme